MNHMKNRADMGKRLVIVSVLALAFALPQVLVAEEITGEWEMTMEFGGRQRFVTLAIAKGPDGTLSGKWGSSELSNVRFDGTRLSFTRTVRMGDREFTSNYTGTLKDGKIIGIMSSDRGEYAADGARVKPKSPALGQWDMQYQVGDRDITGRLAISQRSDGTLEGKWISDRGEHTISNVKFQNGKLTFDRTSTFGDRQWESSFEGTVAGDKLTGVFKSQRGEIPAGGERFGAPVIGKWELTTTSDRGTRTRTLTIYADLTGRYESFGTEIPIKDLKLEGNQMTFAAEAGFGDQAFTMDFKAEIKGKALAGTVTSPRGTSEVSGKKLEPASAVVGTWEFTRETPRGTRTSTLKIKADMTGTYTVRDDEVPVTDLTIDGDQVSFKVTMTFGENEVTMEFKGKVEGATLKGDWTTPRGTTEMTGKKVP